MTDRLTIENALDELIKEENDRRFEDIAKALAKKQWPGLIASESKKDLGADAHAPGSLAADGSKVLACSITATLQKVKGDATKVRDNFPGTKTLIFATPRPVTNQTIAKWAKEIVDAFDYELVVWSRSDIVLSLMEPENAWICRDILRIPIAIAPTDAEWIAKVSSAAAELTANWRSQRHLANETLIGLRAVHMTDDGTSGEVFDLPAMANGLRARQRLILEAPAGRGKTTTLIQIAMAFASARDLAFLVDLPEWSTSGRPLLEYLAGTPPVQANGVDSATLARVLSIEPCVFLFNGWNEVSATTAEAAELALRSVDRDFPNAGILIATRPHAIRPPFVDPVRLSLLALTRSERTKYLVDTLRDRSAELRAMIENNDALDDLTRTPFILRAVRRIFEAGRPLPTTKVSVLETVLQVLAGTPEHRSALQRPPLDGYAGSFLAALATHMTKRATVTISANDARAVVHATANELAAAKQLAVAFQPAQIVDALTAHHVLVRVEYPTVEFRFEHQQFQEFFAAVWLRDRLDAAAGDDKTAREFASYVDAPSWEEPLRMIAGDIGADEAGRTAGARLVLLALDIDPIFAAELARLAGLHVWREVGSRVGERLREWYGMNDGNHQQCALAAMIASGSADFSDVLLPLLTSVDEQVRLRTYRTWPEFHLSTLGIDWRAVVSGWNESARRTFVGELTVHQRRTDVAEHLALNDESVEVRKDAARDLTWIGSPEAVRSLQALPAAALQETLLGLDPEDIPGAMTASALATYDEKLETAANPRDRLRLLLRRGELGKAPTAEEVKDALSEFPDERLEHHDSLVRRALEIVSGSDRAWVSEWVARRILTGTLWIDAWKDLISDVPETLKHDWLARIDAPLDEDNDRGIIGLLPLIADLSVSAAVFARLCDIQRAIDASEAATDEQLRVRRQQLESVFRRIPPPISLGDIERIVPVEFDPVVFRVLTELLGSTSIDDPDLRATLSIPSRDALRRYLKAGVPFARDTEDTEGALLAHVATSLSRVGREEDVDALEVLIHADVARVNRNREAVARGEQPRSMKWSMWHVRAVVALGGDRAATVLLNLLTEQEYEVDAAGGLLQIAVVSGKRELTPIWRTRPEHGSHTFREEARSRYAEALTARIANLREESKESNVPERYAWRLQELAGVLAELDPRGSVDLALTIAALPAQWATWRRLAILEKLVFGGGCVPAHRALEVCDLIVDHVRKAGVYDNQNVWLLKRCLSLMPFFDPAAAGIARLRELVSALRFPSYELRDLFATLSRSRTSDALAFLRDVAALDGATMKGLWRPWIEAVAAFDTEESQRLLGAFLQPDNDLHSRLDEMEPHEMEFLATTIANAAKRSTRAETHVLGLAKERLTPSQAGLLVRILAALGTPDAVFAGLEVLGDEVPLPYELWRALEELFLEQRPDKRIPNAYSLVAKSASAVRKRLLSMVVNDHRRTAAFSVLGQIEVWRLENGRPIDEPRHPAIELDVPWPPLHLFAPQ